MELSAELFEQTICALKGFAAIGRTDKRSTPRVGVRCKIKLAMIEDDAPAIRLDVWTRDISRGGIGLLCPRPIKVGARFIMSLPRGDGNPPLVLVCTVKTCASLSPKLFSVGAEFHQAAEKSAAA